VFSYCCVIVGITSKLAKNNWRDAGVNRSNFVFRQLADAWDIDCLEISESRSSLASRHKSIRYF
jgi:hypothetical protein